MSSLFYKISPTSFLEASPIYDNPLKSYGLRIVSIDETGEHFVFLPSVSLPELKMVTQSLHLSSVPQFRHFDDVRLYWYK